MVDNRYHVMRRYISNALSRKSHSGRINKNFIYSEHFASDRFRLLNAFIKILNNRVYILLKNLYVIGVTKISLLQSLQDTR